MLKKAIPLFILSIVQFGCQTLETLNKDCSLGDSDACLAQAFLKASAEPRIGRNERDKVAKFYGTYIEDINTSCKLDNPQACGLYAYYFAFIEKDYNRAKEYYDKACSLGDTYSCYYQTAISAQAKSDKEKVALANEFKRVCEMPVEPPPMESLWLLTGKDFAYGHRSKYVRAFKCEKYLHSEYFRVLACAKEEELKDMKTRVAVLTNFKDTICIDKQDNTFTGGTYFYGSEGLVEIIFPFEKFYPTLALGKSFEVEILNRIGRYGVVSNGKITKLKPTAQF